MSTLADQIRNDPAIQAFLERERRKHEAAVEQARQVAVEVGQAVARLQHRLEFDREVKR